MKYILTKPQWIKLFHEIIEEWQDYPDQENDDIRDGCEYESRQEAFHHKYPSIKYYENIHEGTSPEYWGVIIGEEKYITMLLLQL